MAKKKDESKTSKNEIKIRVFMRFGAEIRQKRAEYMAKEVRDNYNNLVALNDSYGHNEDVDFSQEEVYSAMNITLGISGLTRDAALSKIDESIKKYEKRVQALEKHPELNVYANVWDEKRKLRELKIYRNYIKNRSENGAYFTIDDGIRVYDFESVDGFLIPIWHGADNLSDYPDFTRKKKITMQETANLESYFASKGTQKVAISAMILVMVITAVVFGITVFAAFKTWSIHEEQIDQWEAPANFCANQMAKTYGTFSKLISDSTIREYIEENNATISKEVQQRIKELNPDTK